MDFREHVAASATPGQGSLPDPRNKEHEEAKVETGLVCLKKRGRASMAATWWAGGKQGHGDRRGLERGRL